MTERENEKEIILGNGQLISLFFVVVALCGVFFTLGYMIGRNSGHPPIAGVDAATPGSAQPSGEHREPEPGPSPSTAQPSVAPNTSLPDTPPPPLSQSGDAPPAVQTQSAKDLPVTPAPAPSKDRTSSKPAPAAPPAPAPAAVATATTEIKPREAGATYLQVAALRHDDAAKLVRTLREQELPAQLAESSKPDFFRVLVGPYHQPSQVAEAKAKLKTLGFANAFVEK